MDAPIPEIDRLTLTRHPGALAADSRLPLRAHFLLFDEDSCRPVAVPPDGELTVGRGHDVSVRVDDASVSRRHARIVTTDGEVLVFDLGSHNGTLVNGQRVTEPRRLSAGDVVTVGCAQLVFHRDTHAAQRPRALNGAEFTERLEQEVARALRGDQPASVLCARLDAEGGSDRAAVLNALGPHLRLMDTVGFWGASELFLVLPELAPPEDDLDALVQALATAVPGVRCGVAVCPMDGADVDGLLGVARATAEMAQPGRWTRPENLACVRTVGGRSVVVADPAMVRVFALADRLAASELPVLIGGETGTGKELIARTLHEGSRRRDRALRSINCAALPEGLIESELFGHARGAFSGAVANKVGLIESAQGGTVFFDEVGELPGPAQSKLLRVLETRKLTRVGEVEERPVDVRIIAATHRELAAEVEAGRFRQDLYYRFGAARIVLPPLRERPRELAILAGALLKEACGLADRAPMVFSPGAVAALRAHSWPGNVRELKNVLELIASTQTERVVQPWHVEEALGPPHVRAAGTTPAGAARMGAAKKPEAIGAGTAGVGVTSEVAGAGPTLGFRPIDEEVRELEHTRMRQAMEASGGVKKRAAALLAMPLRTFVTKYKLYGLGEAPPASGDRAGSVADGLGEGL